MKPTNSRKMNRSDYRYAIKEYAGPLCVLIEDRNLGRMSVTNDIENVIREIAETEGIEAANYIAVYRDSEGIWDGWVQDKKTFVSLDCRIWSDAVEAFIRKGLQ